MNKKTKLLVLWGYGYVARALVYDGQLAYLASQRRLGNDWELPFFKWSSGAMAADWQFTVPENLHSQWALDENISQTWVISFPPTSHALPQTTDKVDCLIYLSSTSVYGDNQGAWVTEETKPRQPSEYGLRRLEAEEGWRQWSAQNQARYVVLRLGGIYGPGRNLLLSLNNGTARAVDKPGHTLNRIHRDDIVQGIKAVAAGRHEGIFNLVDDMPANPLDALKFAGALMGRAVPDPFTLADQKAKTMSPRALMFWQEHKRVSNAKVKKLLGWSPKYADYRAGLEALWRHGTWKEEEKSLSDCQ